MAEKINILHISRTSKLTGPENIFIDIIERLDRTRFAPMIALPDRAGDFYKKLRSRDVDVLIKKMPFIRMTRNPFLLIWFFINIIIINFSFFAIIRRKKIDIIVCNTIHEVLFIFIPLKILNKKLVFCFKNILDKKWKKKIRAWFSDIFADSIIAVSRKALEDYTLFSSKKKQSKKIIEVIHDGIDCNSLRKKETGEDLRRESDEFIILNIGNLTELKGQLLLLKALNSEKIKALNIKTLLIGDIYHESEMPYKEEIKKFITINKLDKKVSMPGYKKNISQYLKYGDIVVHCPIMEDAFPRVILEAFCFKKIVIATNIGGIPEMIKDNHNGFLCGINSGDLADKILYVYRNFNKLDSIKNNAFKSAEEDFSVKKQVIEMERIYNKIKNIDKG